MNVAIGQQHAALDEFSSAFGLPLFAFSYGLNGSARAK
jgi:hypothetical protein